MSILSLAARTRRSALSGRVGVRERTRCSDALRLTMIPLELTTPDLLNAAASLAALGAMLRLRRRRTAVARRARARRRARRRRADQVVHGALGVWSALPSRLSRCARRGRRPLALAIGAWLIILLPWGALMTRAAGRPTFGDAGRLTYAWYVNGQDAPSLGGVPPGTRRTSTEQILPGVGVPGDAPGSDPMWFDPARWNRTVVPRLSLRDQLLTLKVFELFYVQNFTPLLFLFLLIAVAPRASRPRRLAARLDRVSAGRCRAGRVRDGDRHDALRHAVRARRHADAPGDAAARHGGSIRIAFCLAWPFRSSSSRCSRKRRPASRSLHRCWAGCSQGCSFPHARRVVWLVTLLAALLVTRVMLPPVFPELLRVGAAGLAVILWRASLARRAKSSHGAVRRARALGARAAAVRGPAVAAWSAAGSGRTPRSRAPDRRSGATSRGTSRRDLRPHGLATGDAHRADRAARRVVLGRARAGCTSLPTFREREPRPSGACRNQRRMRSCASLRWPARPS